MDISSVQDFESYMKGQLDLAEYLYELLITEDISKVASYLKAVHDSQESRCRHGT